MTRKKSSTSPGERPAGGVACAALIGDLVRSRTSRDRRAVQRVLAAALTRVNEVLDPLEPLRVTVGDEYQGRFVTLGGALQATLLLRVALLPDVDVRQGVGWGEAVVLSEDPLVEDGSAWWVARDAIEAVEADEDRTALRGIRTAYRRAVDVPGPEQAAVEAALMTRDQLVSGLSARGVSVLRGLLAGRTQGEIAAAEGVSASAVSQRVRGDGLQVVVVAHELLGDVGEVR